MTVDQAAPPRWWQRMPPVIDLAQYAMLAFIFASALAGAFTHMHDWTIREINAALVARGLTGHTPEWYGWANAVTSELLPTSAFLSIQQRKRQGRSVGAPTWIFTGAFVVSCLAQLSATGIDIPYAAEFLAMLPALAVLILSKVIFGDVEHAGKVRADAEELARKQAADAARRAARAAELAAELAERRAAEAAELERNERRQAAELAARLDRENREHAAAIELQKIEAEQAGITERARLEASTRQREDESRERLAREERERQARAEADERQRRHAIEAEAARVKARATAEAERIEAEARAALVRAEAERIEAEAQARKAAAERVAQARTADHEGEAAGTGRARRPRHETQALVDDVLATLDAGTTRELAVARVATTLSITPRYARDFVPEGWVAGSAAGSSAEAGDRPGLRLVAGDR